MGFGQSAHGENLNEIFDTQKLKCMLTFILKPKIILGDLHLKDM